MPFEIITIPFNNITNSFSAEDLQKFCMNKRIVSTQPEFFRDAQKSFWTIFIEYEPVLVKIL